MTDATEPESVLALRRIRELYADVDAWVTWADDGQPLEAYAGELLDYIDTLTRERDEAEAQLAAARGEGLSLGRRLAIWLPPSQPSVS